MRRGRLTDEDKRLWAGIARSVRPLPGKPAVEAPPAEAPGTAFAKGLAADEPAVPALPGAVPAVRARFTQHPIERPVKRKIAKGRLPIEGRIDLHEMTQSVAHYALLGFLRRAQGSGLRHVIVITGHGGAAASVSGGRGILRRVVPHWFETPEFRPLVSGFEPAERHHGGEGALYVRVRRPK